jgi:hypothetical protein
MLGKIAKIILFFISSKKKFVPLSNTLFIFIVTLFSTIVYLEKFRAIPFNYSTRIIYS